MKILIILLSLCVISVFIPHNSKKYNFSWYSRILFTTTSIYFICWAIYFIYKTI